MMAKAAAAAALATGKTRFNDAACARCLGGLVLSLCIRLAPFDFTFPTEE